MIALLIVGAYVAVWFGYGWRLSIHLLDAAIRRNLEKWPNLDHGQSGVEKAAEEDRAECLVAGFGLAMFWPVVAPIRGAYRLLRGSLRTPIEVEYAQRAELEALRKLARDNDLPMPEIKR